MATEQLAAGISERAELNFDLGKEKEFLRANIREMVERVIPREYARELDEKEEFPRRYGKRSPKAATSVFPFLKSTAALLATLLTW